MRAKFSSSRTARIGVLGAVGAIVLSLSACGGGGSASGGTPVVRIGLPIPLSGGGANVGERFVQGAKLAIDDLNKAANGRMTFKTVAMDSECTPDGATTAATSLVLQKHVDVMVGELCSSATLAVKAVAEAQQVPLVVPDSSAMAITGPDNKWTFRIIPNEKFQHEALARTAVGYFGDKTFAVAYEQTDSGVGARNVFEAAIKPLGGETVADIQFDQNTPDFSSIVSRITNAAPDAVHLTTLLGPGVKFVKTLRAQGFDARVYSSIWFAYPLFEELAGPAANNNVRQLFYINTSKRPEAQAFTKLYNKAYPNSKTPPDFNNAQFYAAVKLAGKSALDCGTSRTQIKDCLAKTDAFPSPIGPITFDDQGQAVPTSQSLLTIITKNGKAEILDERDDFDAKQIYGVSGS